MDDRVSEQRINPGTGYLGCRSWQGRDEDTAWCLFFLGLRMLIQISFHDAFKVQDKKCEERMLLTKTFSFSFQRMMNLGMNIVM